MIELIHKKLVGDADIQTTNKDTDKSVRHCKSLPYILDTFFISVIDTNLWKL